MELPKLLVVFVFLLIITAFFLRGTRFLNKYVIIGLIIIIALGAFFSDPLYRAINRKVMQYAQSPLALKLPFISERWKSADPQNPNDHTRQRMKEDLLWHHKPSGKRKGEIIDIFGKPDTTKYFPEWDMEYYLGYAENSSRSRLEWLVIKFNRKGVVGKYNILTP